MYSISDLDISNSAHSKASVLLLLKVVASSINYNAGSGNSSSSSIVATRLRTMWPFSWPTCIKWISFRVYTDDKSWYLLSIFFRCPGRIFFARIATRANKYSTCWHDNLVLNFWTCKVKNFILVFLVLRYLICTYNPQLQTCNLCQALVFYTLWWIGFPST